MWVSHPQLLIINYSFCPNLLVWGGFWRKIRAFVGQTARYLTFLQIFKKSFIFLVKTLYKKI